MKTATAQIVRVVHVGILVVLASMAALSTASELVKPQTMIVYADVAGSSEILSGNYKRAIELMAASRSKGRMKISLLNNMCVAFTLDGQLESARASCDSVIHEAAQTKNYGDWFQRYASGRAIRRYTSRAHLNRSIFRKVAGDVVGAAQDLKHVREQDR